MRAVLFYFLLHQLRTYLKEIYIVSMEACDSATLPALNIFNTMCACWSVVFHIACHDVGAGLTGQKLKCQKGRERSRYLENLGASTPSCPFQSSMKMAQNKVTPCPTSFYFILNPPPPPPPPPLTLSLI